MFGSYATLSRLALFAALAVVTASSLAAADVPSLKILVYPDTRAEEPYLRVVDRKNCPVAGAPVTFVLPNSGPSGTFSDLGRVLTVFTNKDGYAAATGMVQNGVPGKFRMAAVTKAPGKGMEHVRFDHPNSTMPRVDKCRGFPYWVLAVVGGAGGVAGIWLATRRPDGPVVDGRPPTPTTISAGTPRVGGPP